MPMKRVALWITALLVMLVVVSSTPGYTAVTHDPVVNPDDGVTTEDGNSFAGEDDDGDADTVGGLRDPSPGVDGGLSDYGTLFGNLSLWLRIHYQKIWWMIR